METINNGLPIKSVKETVELINRVVKNSAELRSIRVRGEISGVYHGTTKNGYPYYSFTMKEGADNQIYCSMFRNVRNLGFVPVDGITVICEGSVTLYPTQSKYELDVSSMIPDGEGAEAVALDALFRRLEAEGLFRQKRPLPKYPKKIALITSPTGAAVDDFRKTILQKYPVVEILLIPSLVQGETAVPSLIAGLERAQDVGADLIIFGRGGGSKEDLACFNSEALARAVFASRVPTISAVGHTRDRSVCDRVADAFDDTPTKAGVNAVPDINTVMRDFDDLKNRAKVALNRKLSDLEKSVEMMSKDVQLKSPKGRIELWESNLTNLKTRLSNSIRQRLINDEHKLIQTARSIANFNPLGVLSRGYAIATKDGKAVKSSEELNVGDIIAVKLNEGSITAEVKST